MKAHSSYVPVDTAFPFKGLASTLPADRLPPGYASDLLNVNVRDGVVRRRAGYLKLGQTLDGIPLDFQEFAPIGSTDNVVCFTSLAQYWYDADNDNWVDVSVETTWTYAIQTVPSTTTLTVTEDLTTANNHVDVGTKFIIEGSVSNDGTYTVALASGSPTTITFTPAVVDASDTTGNVQVTRREDIGSATNATKTLVISSIDLTSYISAGDTIYIKDSTANDGVYTVDTIVFSTHTTIVVIEALPDAADTADGYITHRVDRTYSDGDYLNSASVTDTNSKRLLHTNGVDNPLQWFGVTTDIDGHFLRWVPYLANFVTCKTLAVFKEHLFMGGIETTSNEPQLIGWSDSGDFEDHTTGNSGTQILYELTTGIEQLVTLGDRLIVYSKDALVSGIFIGGSFIFAFETVVPAGTRLASAKGISSINVGHVYASEENFFLFDGSRGLRALADLIRTDYKAQRDRATIHQMAVLNDFSKRTVYVALPTIDAAGMIYTMEYDSLDLRTRSWAREQYTHRPRVFGYFTNSFTYTWDDTTQENVLAVALGLSFLPWSQEIGTWSNEGEQANFPVRIFGDSAGDVYFASESVLSDNGSTPEGYWQSGDFTVPEEFLSTEGRWGEIEVEMSGDAVVLEVRENFGSSVAKFIIQTLDGSMTRYRFPIDVTSRTLRIKFRFSGSFEMRWLRLWVKPTSPRS